MSKITASKGNTSVQRRIQAPFGKGKCKAFSAFKPVFARRCASGTQTFRAGFSTSEVPMNCLKPGFWIVLLSLVLFMPVISFADTNCEDGNGQLNPAQPKGTTPEEIIQKLAAREEMFREARNHYTYTQDITVQELDGNTVTGEFRLVQDITFSDKGERLENVTFAPQSSLRQLLLSREDYEDFRS